MKIVPGANFDHYKILASLGAGGMGEVWRARDTRLERDVAIKLLPVEFAKDADRLRRFEVATFPQLSGKWQVSVDGGEEPQWRRDGKELFFTDQDRKLMAAEVKTGSGTFESEAPTLLFETQLLIEKGRNRFVVTGDGQRFLVIAPFTPPLLINITLNWTAEIKK